LRREKLKAFPEAEAAEDSVKGSRSEKIKETVTLLTSVDKAKHVPHPKHFQEEQEEKNCLNFIQLNEIQEQKAALIHCLRES
jgi:hypothetical protein